MLERDRKSISNLISHVWLELKLDRRTESGGIHLHKALTVTARVQTVHGVLDDVQPLVTRRLQVILSREVGA